MVSLHDQLHARGKFSVSRWYRDKPSKFGNELLQECFLPSHDNCSEWLLSLDQFDHEVHGSPAWSSEANWYINVTMIDLSFSWSPWRYFLRDRAYRLSSISCMRSFLGQLNKGNSMHDGSDLPYYARVACGNFLDDECCREHRGYQISKLAGIDHLWPEEPKVHDVIVYGCDLN